MGTSKPTRLIFSCEHGGNRVPPEYRALFRGKAALLATHRGWDPGALPVARHLAAHFGADLCAATVSRLVIDLNRSLRHPKVRSEMMLGTDLERLVAKYYRPHRDEVEERIRKGVHEGARVVHLAIHSFTPVLDGEVRTAELGILYDPKRAGERAFCGALAKSLRDTGDDMRVRRNYPYVGYSDGFTTYLRRKFSAARYLGIEIEINQAEVRDARRLRDVKRVLVAGLADVLAGS